MSQNSRFYRPEYAQQYGEAFAHAVAFVLDRETEFNRDGSVHCEHDPDDPGGTTKYGIDAASHPGVDVANLSEAGAVAIYHAREWQAVAGDHLPGVLALAMLDTAVNPGSRLAALWLQLAIGATPDGVVGPATVAAVAALSVEQAREAALSIQDARARYYEDRPVLLHGRPFRARFLAGWLNRVNLTRAAVQGA